MSRSARVFTLLPMNSTTFKKGDSAYLVQINRHGEYGGWSPTSESLRARVYAEAATITSFGKKQGTAVTKEGNLEHRLYPSYLEHTDRNPTRLYRTLAEVEALVAELGTKPAEENLARRIRLNREFHTEYVLTGRAAPLGVTRNTTERIALETCVALPTVLVVR